jgi:putative nucleotidyltransferase with HDIG domain
VLPERPWSLKKLQPLPPVAVQLMRLVSSDECSFGRLSTLIRTDPAFAAEVLRIANSPLFGFRGEIGNVSRALLTIGLDRLKSLVVTVALRNFLSSTLQDSALRRCWRHSLACASACEELAMAAGMQKDAVYTSGLLHDVGRLGLLASYPAEYSRILDVDSECGLDVLQSERDVFDLDHCQAGTWLVREWALPEELEAITGRHHEEPAADGFDNLKIVQLACRIADSLGFGAVESAGVPFVEIREKLPLSISTKLGPEDQFVLRIGEKTTRLERAMML